MTQEQLETLAIDHYLLRQYIDSEGPDALIGYKPKDVIDTVLSWHGIIGHGVSIYNLAIDLEAYNEA